MTYMFEVLYKSPADPVREAAISEVVRGLGGRLDVREDPPGVGGPVTLTYEFDDGGAAARAAAALQASGEHVEGPGEYAD